MTTHELMQRAVTHHQAGRLSEAEALYRQVLMSEPTNADALHLLGMLLHQTTRHQEAVVLIERAISIRPSDSCFHNTLGEAYRALGQLELAVSSYQRAIALKADFAEVYFNLGNAMQALGRHMEAISAYSKAMEMKADYPELFVNLGVELVKVGRFDEAIVTLRRATEIAPELALAHYNLAMALQGQDRLDEAISAYQRAIQIEPKFVNAWLNLGNALRDKGLIDDALAAYEKVINLEPLHAGAHLNKALMLLLKGDFHRGWPEYEWRWEWSGRPSPMRKFTWPVFETQNLRNRSIMIYAEQGVGDVLQFVRYAPMLARRGAHVLIKCQPELKRLLQSIEGVTQVIVEGEPSPPTDLELPMLSLPLAFGTALPTIPSEVPYLRPNPTLAQAWRERIHVGEPTRASLHVGLVWAGNPARPGDRLRSISLSVLAPLGEVKDIVFYSLQKGLPAIQAKYPPQGMRLIDLTDDLHDFADTAALITNLDLVISVDTAVAHLAGALAKPVWTLLEFVPAWRWMLDREDSPWYPTMRLFRQPKRGDWASVIHRMVAELRSFAGASRNPL